MPLLFFLLSCFPNCSHVIENRFTEDPPRGESVLRTSVANLSQVTTSDQQDDSDLDSNDAYGDAVIDVGMYILQETNTSTSDNSRPKVTIAMKDNAAYSSNPSISEV